MMPTTTIRDVAATAAVSAATVSRVLNGRVDVAPELRDRVLAAVAQLNYGRTARAQPAHQGDDRAGRDHLRHHQPVLYLNGARRRGCGTGGRYSVVLANTDEDLDKERRYVEVAAAEQMAGVVLSPASSSHTSISYLVDRNIPVVTIDRRLRGAPVDSVTVNNFRAAFEATEHLIEQGCRRSALWPDR